MHDSAPAQAMSSSPGCLAPAVSQRVLHTDPAHIEIVLNKYKSLDPPPTNLAQGVSRWDPPPSVLQFLRDGSLADTTTHRYNAVLGLSELRAALSTKLEREYGLDMTGQEVMVCAGGNQAFANAALALLDPGDKVVLPRPYYFSHLCSLQLAGAQVEYCNFDAATLLPDMDHMRQLLSKPGVKMVLITTPSNPTGAVFPQEMIEEVAAMCRERGVWLVADEAYCDFVHDGARHYSPCANRLGMDSIVHLYTFSKSYGLAGWRVGYMVYPARISDHMQKVQDTIPTHAAVASQRLALAALRCDAATAAAPTNVNGVTEGGTTHQHSGHRSSSDSGGGGTGGGGGSAWVRQQVAALSRCREALWRQVAPLGAVRTRGAFYFFVPLPCGVEENDAVDALARRHGVLVTPGAAFGAPGHVRVSYGSVPEEECLQAIERLGEGLRGLAAAAGKGQPLGQ